MESKEIDPETMIKLIEGATTEADNEKRKGIQAELEEYESQFSVVYYSHTMLDCLVRNELIENQVLHLKVCTYLKEYLK